MRLTWRSVLSVAWLVAGLIALFQPPGSAAAQPAPLRPAPRIIFMHHSTGAGLIWGGGVREAFTELGYEFWDHGYNDEGLTGPDGNPTGTNWDVPGDNTDPDGWHEIFNQPVTVPPQNTFSHMLEFDVIIFKSCFPSSDIQSEEQFEAYRSYFLDMRAVMDQHPDKLFIPFTTPPLTPNSTTPEAAQRARRWSEYLTSDEYLAGHPNIAVFDFFSLLADDAGYLRADYRPEDEYDSHPNELANMTVGPVLVEFVTEAERAFSPGEAPPLPEPQGEVPPADQPGPAEGEVPAALPAGIFDNFETPGFEDRWWTYIQENINQYECVVAAPGYESEQALRITFDAKATGNAGCGMDIVPDDTWTNSLGIGFVWRADPPGQTVRVVLAVHNPDHPDDYVPFEVVLETPGDKWTPVTLLWEAFQKADWVGDVGPDELDLVLVYDLSFEIGNWETAQAGTIWLDDIGLVMPVE